MMLSYGRQSINEEDIQEVLEVLRSDFLTQGPQLRAFETRVAEYCHARYAVAVTNATSALHIACLAAGLGAGDVLWTVPNTFVASANCGLYCGAEVDFVDIDPLTYNMSVSALEEKLQSSSVLPKIVVPVHFSGQSCEMQRIHELAEQYGFTVLEDASHAIGGEYQGCKVGSCRYSDMTVFSFHPVKIITTGEGGMVLTNNEELYRKLLLLRSHGITREEDSMSREADGPWYYEQTALGFNYRMTDIQAALGLSQMNRLDDFVAKRNHLALRYASLLQDLPVKAPQVLSGIKSSWHIYVVCADFEQLGLTKKELFQAMLDKGIRLNLHYIPVHTQPYYQRLGFKWGDFPVSEGYYREAFTIPLYYDMTEEMQDKVVQSLREVLG